ncbi:MAG: metallophosphoesterase [Alphaproteobacteria bacterium]|nr:metallophosphoesterase [Alphaproteobacteria bacterium]
MFKAPAVAQTLAFALVLLSGPAKAEDAIEFIVLGDIPYGQDQIGSLKHIGKHIRKGDYPFVVHYGDVIAGDGTCSDVVLTKRKELIYGLLKGRVFFTPGDNDWTDCDRGGGFRELERLKRLREIFFFGNDLPTEAEWEIARQTPDYPENVRWQFGGIQFVTLHVVGSDNGRHEINPSEIGPALDAVAARDLANFSWLDAAFDEAEQAQALVAIMHADPYDFVHEKQRTRPCDAQEPIACNPYLTLLERLTSLADAFDKPVLLVHGSTNRFCLDTGFGGWRAQKLWRLNGPGDFVTVDAAVVRFEQNARAPFQVRGLLSGDAAVDCRR